MLKAFKNMFKIDYDKRTLEMAEETLYDARRDLIKLRQEKQLKDAMVDYATNRVEYLSELVSVLRSPKDGKIPTITNIGISATK